MRQRTEIVRERPPPAPRPIHVCHRPRIIYWRDSTVDSAASAGDFLTSLISLDFFLNGDLSRRVLQIWLTRLWRWFRKPAYFSLLSARKNGAAKR
jgi:hypothetical protein